MDDKRFITKTKTKTWGTGNNPVPLFYARKRGKKEKMGVNIIKNSGFVSGRNCGARTESVKYIVIHYTGSEGTAANNVSYFNGGNRGASAHYFVGQNGEVREYCDPAKWYAWHCGGSLESSHHPYYGKCTNRNSIGIEICTHNNGSVWTFTETAVNSAVELTKYLMAKFSVPADRVIRHWDVTGKSCLPVDVTELLTPNGWIGLRDVKVGTKIAQYEPDGDAITFTPVLDVVEQREEIVYKNRYLEATADHRMYTKPNAIKSHEFKDVLWGDLLTGKKSHIIKNAAYVKTDGIALTDNEIRLLVWIQGDGYYMMDKHAKRSSIIKGVEFHVKKPRKIARITELLDEMDIPYYVHSCKNGSVHIRIIGESLYYWAETWLSNKVFNYNLMFMNQRQFEVFWDEIVKVDGNEEGQLYTSAINRNNDVVQAVCALHGKRSSKISLGKAGGVNTILTAESNYTVGRGGNNTPVEERKTLVSCVTVQSGYILARINNRTFIVGNCPRVPGWGAVGGDAEWKKFKNRLSGDNSVTVEPRSLSKGDEGDDVKKMQTMLIACGYSCGTWGADGDFGAATDSALRKFQGAKGLTIDGVYGPKSRAALETAYKKAHSENSRGRKV